MSITGNLFLIAVEIISNVPIRFCKSYKTCLNILYYVIYFVTHLNFFGDTLIKKH